MTIGASPARAAPGATVLFSVSAHEAQARGALGYRLSYGDGTTDQNVVPLVCLGGAGSAQGQTWRLSHRYATGGVFDASVTVSANCTPDRATVALSVAVA